MSRLLRLPRALAPARLIIRPYSSSPFQQGPAPPRLPASEQAEFDRLQREAAVSSAFRVDEPTPSTSPQHVTRPAPAAPAPVAEATTATAETKGTDFNSGIFRGAPPEFDGDVNPKTGEVGGPKNEPLRWGDSGDWSYNGRVTDF
jgi:uncharacterized protein DUF1674